MNPKSKHTHTNVNWGEESEASECPSVVEAEVEGEEDEEEVGEEEDAVVAEEEVVVGV